MRLSFSPASRAPQRAPEQAEISELGMVYGCEADGCGKLALQSCIRCGLRFCTLHIRAWERDLPTRGLKLYPPDWYCLQCRGAM